MPDTYALYQRAAARPLGKRVFSVVFANMAPYFRTAVHEIGHARGLYHNPVDNGFMHTTPDIAANAVPPCNTLRRVKSVIVVPPLGFLDSNFTRSVVCRSSRRTGGRARDLA